MKYTAALAFSMIAAAATSAAADTTVQSLPFSQDWTNIGLITADDNWSGVPGVIGYRGDSLVATTGVNPQTVTADGSSTPVDVNANQTSGSFGTGGVSEFHLTDPVVGIKGSGSPNKAPHLVIRVDTTGVPNVRVRYTLRDIDGGANNSVQPFALQYRVGTTGTFTDVPAAFIADATTTASTPSTAIDVLLPAAAGNQPSVDIRIITADAVGTDEYVGIDNIIIGPPASLTATGSATPDSTGAATATHLAATVSPGSNPTSSGVAISCDLTAIGGSAVTALFDDGAHGDGALGDNVFGLDVTIAAGIPAGDKTIPCGVADAQARTSTFSIAVTVVPVCGDGHLEGTEVCDDDDSDTGDGCDDACQEETGFTCVTGAGEPSVCTDDDECVLGTDDCGANATCTNTPGAFSCACDAGYDGDGLTCVDIDECATSADDCDVNALCTNTIGDFTCACNDGYSGDGVTCVDIDECATSADDCSANAACTNTPGDFTCECNDGYSGDGVTCTDVDECTTGADDCSANAACTNTPGGFSCECNDGYQGDGVICDDINECAAEVDDCDVHAECTNTPGAFTCACDTGYDGDGTACADIDECDLGTDNCDNHASCTNSTGSFSCLCDTGFSGNGVACAPICGDSTLVAGEECDDGDAVADDGCDAACQLEDGWDCCTAITNVCTEICGDGLVVGSEGCDDAGTDVDDGCDGDCVIEDGWLCTGEPSSCSLAVECGNGTVDAGETCDDGDADAGDGCDDACAVEAGWECTGTPSVCTETSFCGDGIIDDGEGCDDGNDAAGDGCDDACAVEGGSVCVGEPSECDDDSDGDGVGDAADVCPDVADPAQLDGDDDGIGDACDDTAVPGNDGCCSTSSRGAPGAMLLALMTLVAIRRRRRRT
jgi:uncharacterized protein (TIGR03382 family)